MAPGAGIIVGVGSTFDIQRSNFVSCDAMWRGIWMESGNVSSSTLKMISVYISDAEYAVWPGFGSIVNISNTRFDKNYTGLFYNADDGFTLDPFESNKFTASANLLPPYTGQLTQPGSIPFAGIDTRNQSLLNIGVGGNARFNLFQNLANGILTDGATLNVINTRFENILKTNEYPASNGFGISCRAVNNRLLYQDGILSNNSAGLPTFKNCTQAIRVQQMQTAIFNNVMEEVVNGIRVEGVSGLDIGIELNEISCKETGIELIENDVANRVWVAQNTIAVGESVSGTVFGLGIYVSENGSLQSDAQILNNVIALHQVNFGISLVKASGYSVENNILNLHSPSLNFLGLGVADGNTNELFCNKVFGSGRFPDTGCKSNSWLFCNKVFGSGSGAGIYNSSAFKINWKCNDVQNTFAGAAFFGACNGTSLTTTDFIPPLNTGLYYDGSVMIDAQIHQGNRWNAGAYANAAARWDGVMFQQLFPARYEVHTQSAPFYPPSFNLPIGINPSDWFIPSNGSPLSCSEETVCLPSGFTGGEGETRKKIASGEYTNPLYNGAITWQAQRQVFATLDDNPALQSEYPEVAQFYEANEQSAIGQLHGIDKSIDLLHRLLLDEREAIALLNIDLEEAMANVHEIDADLLEAEGSTYTSLLLEREAELQQIAALGKEVDSLAALVKAAQITQADVIIAENAAIATDTIYQLNEKIVNDIYLATRAKGHLTFTPAQASVLKEIAEQCPLSGGTGVYKARSLYALIERAYYDDEQLCTTGNQLRQSIGQSLPTQLNGFSVYPNPNTGAFTLEYPIGTMAQMMLYDLMGHLIYKQALAQDEHRKEFLVGQFQPGIYFLKILTEGRIVHAEKIIIIR